ncbi:MAG TPA: hypothetical protein VK206_12615, partial [Anaerolineales bacterium]|nr:hypothetical protein [Anaerolineales bacterium]
GGNIITLNKIQDGWGRVNTLETSSAPSAATVNYFTRPDLIHKFVVVGWKRDSRTTIIVNPPKGDLYWPLVTKSPVWIPMDRLERFPTLPMMITANTDLYIQATPGPNIEKSKFQLLTGKSTRLIAYYPSGSNVWGQVQSGGWIPLLIYPRYLTSWQMETVPPPP